MQHDLMRSIKKAPFLLMESCPSATNWKPVNKLKKSRNTSGCFICRQLLNGSDSVRISSFVRVREPLRNSMVR